MRIRIRNNGLTHSLTQPLRSDRTPADGVSVHCLPVLRSRHFLGRLRLWMAKVPEQTPAPGRLQLQAKIGGFRRLRLHTLKFFIVSFQKVNY